MKMELALLTNLLLSLVMLEALYCGFQASLYWTERLQRKRLEKRLENLQARLDNLIEERFEKSPNNFLAAFTTTFEIMRKSLPGVSSIISTMSEDGKYILHVRCLTCKKENRLGKGLKGAACGQCHSLLSEPPAGPVGPSVITEAKLVN